MDKRQKNNGLSAYFYCHLKDINTATGPYSLDVAWEWREYTK